MEKFYWMWRNELQSIVEYDVQTKKVKVKNIGTDPLKLAFGIITEPKWKDLVHMLSERCVPSSRQDLRVVLNSIGVPYHDPFLITRKNHGQMMEDFNWLKYEHEKELRYEDITYRLEER